MFRWVYDLAKKSELSWLNAMNDGKKSGPPPNSDYLKLEARFFWYSQHFHSRNKDVGHFRLWTKDIMGGQLQLAHGEEHITGDKGEV
jgi:hypothetical protein